MDFQAMYTRVGELLEDTSNTQWLLPLVKQYINDGAADFARKTGCIRKRSAALDVSATLPTRGWYTLPEDFHELVEDAAPRFGAVKSAGRILLPLSSTIPSDDWEDETGTEQYYDLGRELLTEIRVTPVPAAALTDLRVYYKALPETMVDDNDTPAGIPAKYHLAPVYYATAKCWRRNGEESDLVKALSFERDYQELVDECLVEVARRHSSLGAVVPFRRF